MLEFESEQRCCFESDHQGADFAQELPCNSLSLPLGMAWESTDRIWRLFFVFLLDTLFADNASKS